MQLLSSNVIELLTYIEEVEKLKRKPTYLVPGDFFVGHLGDLKGLPELQSNLIESDGGEVWLRIPRLQEIAPPELLSDLDGWVTLSKSPDKGPLLKENRAIRDGQQVQELALKDFPHLKFMFSQYLEHLWTPWSQVEKLRRKTIALYNKLFSLYQTLSVDGAENPVELVWGLGLAVWKMEKAPSRVEHPLLTQACEIRLDPATFALNIGPRDVDTRIELDCYAEMELPGVLPLEALWREMQSKQAASVNPFDSSTYENILKAAVAHLDPSGRYLLCESQFAVPAPSEQLLVSDRWVVFARKRSADIFLEDVRRLKKKVADGAAIPPVIGAFVQPGDSLVRIQPEVSFRGLSTSISGAGVRELYFPLPYNEEQVSIVRKLESNDGVVVQGPPGTGKTHTIANVICHFLAQGKRVLVTSKGDTALAVLQEKLPERIRPLSVALLADEKDGMKQFEHSIEKIASEVSALRPEQLQSNIANFETQLNELHARVSAVDQAIATYAAQNMQTYVYQGREVNPEELAKRVMSQYEEHQWFDDSLPEDADAPPLTEDDVVALRKARLAVGLDLHYLQSSLPEPSLLPTWEELLSLHKDILRARHIDAQVDSGAVHALKDSSVKTFEAARTLTDTLTEYISLHAKVQNHPAGRVLRDRFRDMQADDVLLKSLYELKELVEKLEDGRKVLLTKAIVMPDAAEMHQDFLGAVQRLVDGKSAFALPFGKSDARKMAASVSIAGGAPSSSEQWKLVQKTVVWRLAARREIAKFSTVAAEFGLAAASGAPLDVGVKQAYEQFALVDQVHELVFRLEREVLSGAVAGVFGTAHANNLGEDYESKLPALLQSLNAHLDKGRLGYALSRLSEFRASLDRSSGHITIQLKKFLSDQIGSDTDERSLRAGWAALVDEAKRLQSMKPHFGVIAQSGRVLSEAGALKWAKRIQTEAPSKDSDTLTPSNWKDAWTWRIAFQLLERIDAHSRMRGLFDERRSLTTRLSKTYQDLVAEKTWLGVYQNSPPSIRQALQGYLNSVQAMGAGTGVRAIRHRKNAREAMSRAYQAVPCWVLPQWRVSETLPAELGLFDLVVVDEASQSDIWALPALMRGKKLLVVGDHKQVSPLVVGMPEQKIVDIQRRFLEAQPHGRYMTPDSSIYDLARVIFAGNSVMLKEHFRCVPAIIEYSNREFYEGEIRALRVPKSNERLDPPLIDVFVKGGYRKGDVNRPEAEAIVQQIEAIINDYSVSGRTIGVVTLLGSAQAKEIHDLVNRRISAEQIIARRITVGPPPLFQGRERDIMLVSMVLQNGDNTAANMLAQQQRFNVALSRARDRTYLFRSVQDDAFSPDSLSGRLLRHFRQPFSQDEKVVAASRELCESAFEEEVFDELTRRGFRVRPQVPCGGYRIDMVVEGKEGRRLAVECDGDRYHGPGQWGEDMARQRVLERAGWVFWRCFASSFVRRRGEVLADLWSTLERLRIEPMTGDDNGAANSVWVKRVEADPYRLEQIDERLAAAEEGE
jgi:very-short-patch-repair endonuclease